MMNYKPIRELRKSIYPDMSMHEFCKKSGVTMNTLSMIENGNTNPKLETLEKIALALNIPCEMLMWVSVKSIMSGNRNSKYLALKTTLDNIFKEIIGVEI